MASEESLVWVLPIWSDSLVAIYGHPKSGKSFIAIDMAARLAAGVDWAGYSVRRKHRTFYLPLEGHYGVIDRLKALAIEHPALAQDSNETFRHSNVSVVSSPPEWHLHSQPA